MATGIGEPERGLSIIEEAEAAASKGDIGFLRPRTSLSKARALLALERLDECDLELAGGLASAREQKLVYEEGLLLRVSADLEMRRGDQSRAQELSQEADRLLARLGVQGADERSARWLAAHPQVAEDVDEVADAQVAGARMSYGDVPVLDARELDRVGRRRPSMS